MGFQRTDNVSPGAVKRHQEYLNLREIKSKYRLINGQEKLSVHMQVFCILLDMNERKIKQTKSLRKIQAEVMRIYIRRFRGDRILDRLIDSIPFMLQVESSVGRAIRKIREDNAMDFHKKTYAGKSKKHEVNTEDHGETAIEELSN